MDKRGILIVDDEKNIRMTLENALQSVDMAVDTAKDAEEALHKLEEGNFGLILLDLRLPGMSGMEMLEQVAEQRPDIKVIIITAHGSVESATDAMKQGAVDYIQKPFSPEEIRQLVNNVLGREDLEDQEDGDYETQLELIKKNIQEKHFQAAAEQARTAVAMDASRPEGHNLLGALMEILGNDDEAQDNYRKAVSLDPTYEPARNNLNRISGWEPGDTIHLDDGDEAEDSD